MNNVHAIAWHYGWTEDQILRLPTVRRNKYLEMIEETNRKNNKTR
jgi:hypothetical protein